mmetsp:Transcript_31893/g.53959  ORF Transcript_31893/g.53959 Transcript_31893/m.53959 type:complete len:396 (-) Transcript_31893:3219-4406(-)
MMTTKMMTRTMTTTMTMRRMMHPTTTNQCRSRAKCVGRDLLAISWNAHLPPTSPVAIPSMRTFQNTVAVTNMGLGMCLRIFLRSLTTVSAWRRLSPNQQKDICEQLATQRKQKVSAARELKEIEKKKKQAEKENAKQRKAETKAAKKKATEENRKAKKKESEQRRRDEAKAIAAQKPIASRHLNPEAAVQASFSQQQLTNASAVGAKRKVKEAPSRAKHMNDQTARKAEKKMLKSYYDVNNIITPKETDQGWLKHNHLLITSSELPDAPRGNGGPSTRNTVNDPKYDAAKPLNMTVRCASQNAFEDFVEDLLNSDNPIVQTKLRERLEHMQHGNTDGEANTRGVSLSISTEMPSSDSGDRAVAETTQSVSALAANTAANIEREIIGANDAHNMFV